MDDYFYYMSIELLRKIMHDPKTEPELKTEIATFLLGVSYAA